MIEAHLPNHSFYIVVVSLLVWAIIEFRIFKKNKNTRPKKEDRKVIFLFSMYSLIVFSISYWLLMGGYGYVSAAFFFFTWIGLALLFVGILFRQHAMKVMGVYYVATLQTQDKQELIQHGPFSMVRHPCYTGFLLSLWGFSLCFNNLLFFLLVFVSSLIVMHHQIRVEEKELTALFGDTYLAYSKRTKKLFPFIY